MKKIFILFLLLSYTNYVKNSLSLSNKENNINEIIENHIYYWNKINNEHDASLEKENIDSDLNEILETLRKPKAREIFEGIQIEYTDQHSQSFKEWTVLIYIAGDNDLYRFALRNIEQLKQLVKQSIGKFGFINLNILIHFDFHQNGKSKETRRFFVEKDRLLQIGKLPPMDSGSEKTLADAGRWAISNYPSRYFSLVLWNHGAGDLNPERLSRLVNPSEFFYYNPETRQIELDRSISFMEYLSHIADRGICFDNTTGNYLNDEKLHNALGQIKLMLKKNIDVILMDACLMAGIGTSFICSKHADYLVASQEVVLGPGYNYTTTLQPLITEQCLPEFFAKSVVKSYESTYGPITKDYTESAINLRHVAAFCNNLDKLASLIIKFLPFDQNKAMARTVKLCANKELCTHFEEPTYIDIKHFYENLLHYCSQIKLYNDNNESFFEILKHIIQEGLAIYQRVILLNSSGSNYPRASGLSIYFPQRYMHSSFKKTFFGQVNSWTTMLEKLVRTS